MGFGWNHCDRLKCKNRTLAVGDVEQICGSEAGEVLSAWSGMRRKLLQSGGASQEGVLVKGSNYLEILSQSRYVVFDKTGTLTQGVFEVNGIHHNEMEDKKLVEYAALAESASSHPISRSLQRAYGKEIDRTRVSDIREISGNGVIAKVDGTEVAARRCEKGG